jgi:hypothetical protein
MTYRSIFADIVTPIFGMRWRNLDFFGGKGGYNP